MPDPTMVVTLADAGALLLAEFPRGPGFYYSLPKVLAVALVYLGWIRACAWVDGDAPALHLPRSMWLTVLWLDGVFGLLVVWLLPWFVVSFSLLVFLAVAPTLAYIYVRDQKVGPGEQVLSPAGLERFFGQLFRINFKRSGKNQTHEIPVRFIGKSFGQSNEDESRVSQAKGSKGYRAARRMVYEAIQERATDIHLEPNKEDMTLRFRIDGILQAAAPFTREMGESVINIFKVLGRMDISEKRRPQDGSFSAQIEERLVDFRVASAGSVLGEKLVLRILDTSQQITELERLGMGHRLHEEIERLATQPHGMFIVCGPTGAGKTTTLYACLHEIDRLTTNVITIENPVEYKVSNATQIEINVKAGKTFASELRSILRQDPDVIFVGEIRDNETAEIACQAAQTGHMVFTSLHANDSVTALARLIDLGVQPFMLSNAISAILAQRLIRLLCPACKVKYKPSAAELRRLNLPGETVRALYRPPEENEVPQADDGEPELCEQCEGKGYFGRTGIFELMVVNDRMRELIRENPDMNAIRQEAVKSGMRYLFEEGQAQVLAGKTSLSELLRVCK